MIGSLRGRILEKAIGWILIEVNNIGYRVNVPPALLSAIHGEGETFLYIHHHVREDAADLYGFLHLADLELFEKLIGISGIGPRVGATIMSVGSADVIRGAIMRGDLAMLTSVPGVGKKTAQKIVLELKGQLVEDAELPTSDGEVAEALQALGYSMAQIRQVLPRLLTEVSDTSQRVREALQLLGK